MYAQPVVLSKGPLHSIASSLCQYRGHDILDLLKDARNYNGWLADQVAAAKPRDARQVVDLGAGRGTFAEMLRTVGLEVDCVEPDLDNQRTLRERGFSVQPTMEEYAPNSLDYIYTLNVLEHVPKDEELLRDAFSRLRSGGRLFIFVPAFPALWSRLDDYVEHQRRYRRQPMIEMLRRVGFAVERARYADCLGFFAALLFRSGSQTEISPRAVWVYDRLLFPVSKLLDSLLGRFFGKNLAVICRKP